MFRPLVRSAVPQEPSGFWSFSRKSMPRRMELSSCSGGGGGTGLGRGAAAIGVFGLSGAAADAGRTTTKAAARARVKDAFQSFPLGEASVLAPSPLVGEG